MHQTTGKSETLSVLPACKNPRKKKDSEEKKYGN